MRTIVASSLAVLALSGCGAPSRPAAIGGTPSAPARVACPSGDALTAVTRTHFGAAEGDDFAATCTAVYTDRALWLLDGYHYGEDGVALVTALVDPATDTAVWVTGARDFGFPVGAIDRMTGAGKSAADLDGDGRDEIIDITGTMAMGYDVSNLSVYTIGPEGLLPAGEIPFGEDNTAADEDPAEHVSCSTEWKLVPGPSGAQHLDLTVTAATPRGGACLPPGHHVLRWTGKELVEVK